MNQIQTQFFPSFKKQITYEPELTKLRTNNPIKHTYLHPYPNQPTIHHQIQQETRRDPDAQQARNPPRRYQKPAKQFRTITWTVIMCDSTSGARVNTR